MRQIWDWDGQYYTGEIPELNHTYNVVGNTNEWGVVITETTFGGRGDLAGQGTGAIMSYGDLIFTTLTRARTAREAIQVMDELCRLYGYESNGESFGVGDAAEVWLLELVGKGKYGKGAVWVASRVPEGYATATANQARTRTFNQVCAGSTKRGAAPHSAPLRPWRRRTPRTCSSPRTSSPSRAP